MIEIFSKRQKKLRGEIPDAYTYDDLSEPLRVQIVHILTDTLGGDRSYGENHRVREAYDFIVHTLHKEYGVFCLPGLGRHVEGYYMELTGYLLHEKDIERVLDGVELAFLAIDKITRDYDYLLHLDASKRADAAINELNSRFKERGVGYQYTSPKIIRIDSELIHSEVVKPALRLLCQEHFAGAQEEFLKAHEHYRKGNSKEALNDCLKAFESVMKAICDKRGWHYEEGATSKSLIQICLDNGLIPTFWQQQFTSLSSLLESSVSHWKE